MRKRRPRRPSPAASKMGAKMVKDLSSQSTPPAPAAAVLSVLGNDYLLREILLRLGFPTSLVRVALVCKRWYRIASQPDFLRRFRNLHPPRLLGFYVYPTSPSGRISNDGPPQFVPMLPQHPELAAVLRRASFSLDAYASMGIMDCRSGRVLINMLDHDAMFTQGAHLPLQSARAIVMVPPPPLNLGDDTVYATGKVMSKEDEDGLSYFWLLMEFTEEGKAIASVYTLEDDVWSMHTSATTQLPGLPPKSNDLIQPVDDRFYMAGTMSSILVLDLTSSAFFTIELPDGVSFSDGDGDILLSRSDESGIYLVHLKDLKLRIWLHRGIKGSVGGWLLFDTICLCDRCANLRMPNCNIAVSISAVGDNAEFVFLDMGIYVLHLDVKGKVLRKVHEMTEQEETARRIHPFMMPWPPVFPVLKE